MAVVWHPGGQRPTTSGEGRLTRHSLSFGAHYDPGNVDFGGLVAHNDDRLEPGSGYPDHAHVDVEIVTWVLEGVLAHRDSLGGEADLAPGNVQLQSAGSGVRHSEIADPGSGPTRFVQAWIRPDQPGGSPHRELADTAPSPGAGLVPVVAGDGSAPLRLRARGATLWAARLDAGEEVALPEVRRQHLFVAFGGVVLPAADVRTGEGDAVRLVDEPGLRLVASAPTELLVWGFAG